MSRFLRSFGLLRNVAPATRHATTASVSPCSKAVSEGDSSLPFHDSVIYKLDDLKVEICETDTAAKKWQICIPGKENGIKFKSRDDAVHFAIFQGWEYK